MHGREREFSQIIENFTEEQKINALWFEESLVVNTKELSRLILLILIVHEYQHPVMLMNSLYLDGNQKDHEYEEFSEIKHFAHETVCA